jgi:hypothetical protein
MNVPIFQKALENLFIDPCYRNSADYDQFMRESYPKFKEAVYMVGLEKKK